MNSSSSGIPFDPALAIATSQNHLNQNSTSSRSRRARRGAGRGGGVPRVEGEVRLGPNGGESIRGGGRTRGVATNGRGRGRGGAQVNGGSQSGSRTPVEAVIATTSATTLDTPALPPTSQPAQASRPPRPSQANRPNGTAPASNRRAKFNASLSSSTTLSSSTPAFIPPSTSPAPAPSSQTLLERLTTELTSATYDCSICFSNLTKSTAIHSCTTCHSVFHLKCIGEWASRSCIDTAERINLLAGRPSGEGDLEKGTWRCPSCQTPSTAAEIPKVYTCFCGNVKNPIYKAGITPHSCGKQCSRTRPEGCKHVDQLSCHPGPCPPCSILLNEKCHCGKKRLLVKCSSIYTGKKVDEIGMGKEFTLSCAAACGKKLDCGLHFCEKQCHGGECGSCTVEREKSCYCSREIMVEECGLGERERIDCFKPGQELSWEGEFSCERNCDALYDCGLHSCEEGCHPHSSPIPLPCPLSPSSLTHCPCTQTPLSVLLATPRRNCLDLIPTCKKSCPKLLICGHSCGRECHLGECGSCETEVAAVCRCGSKSERRLCGQIDHSELILCNKVCRASRNCGRHDCNRVCCELSWQEALKSRGNGKGKNRRPLDGMDGVDVFSIENDPQGIHSCDRICGRKLTCGIHLCAERDHKGPCRPCLLADFSEMICNCGSTIILPPIACNTTMDCRHPCIRPSICGHATVPHCCHEAEECPPCPYLIAKSCACGKKSVGNQRCSSKNVSCGLPCRKLLRCAFHRCRKLCHTGECEEDTQVCLKPRRICTHPCTLLCHAPSSCSTEKPCQFMIEIECLCGHLKQKVKCATTTGKEGTEEGNREKKLKCTDKCLVAKRNAALAEALGIEMRERKAREVEYLPSTLSFYSDHPAWCGNLEATFIEFVNGDKAALHLPVMKRPQRQFTHELAEAFELRSESMDEEPKRSMLISRQSNSSIPTPTLLESYTVRKPSSSTTLNLGSLKRVPEKALASNAVLLERVGGYEETTLKELLRPFMRGMNFSVLWVTEEDVIVLPILPSPTTTLTPLLPALTNLQETTQFCTSVDLVHYSTETGAVTRGGIWTPVSSTTSGTVTPRNVVKSWGGTNAFSALGETEKNFEALGERRIAERIVVTRESDPTVSRVSSLIAELRAVAANIEKGEMEEKKEVPDDWEQII